jgi:ornithine cyclodeaminase
MREIQQTPQLKCAVVDLLACLAEAGDLIQPCRAGQITRSISREIGEIVLGLKEGRTSPDQMTFFKSVGLAVQDASAARLALENAGKLGLGQRVEW